MPSRSRPKRRSKRSLRARLGTYWVLGAFVAGALAWGAWTLATLPAFRLHELAVTGLARVSRADVVNRAAIAPGANVWFLDTRGIARRVDTIPYVLSTRVHRRPLGNVWIEIVERTPEACVRDRDGHASLVDAQLRVLAKGCGDGESVAYDVRGTIDVGPGTFLRDPEVEELQSDARALASDGDRYRSFSHDSYGELEAVMQSGIGVRFGDDDDLDRKQRLIGPILAELGPRLGNVRTLDVRAPSTPVVEYRR